MLFWRYSETPAARDGGWQLALTPPPRPLPPLRELLLCILEFCVGSRCEFCETPQVGGGCVRECRCASCVTVSFMPNIFGFGFGFPNSDFRSTRFAVWLPVQIMSSRTLVAVLVLLVALVVICEGKNSDKYFLTKCVCKEKPPARPMCDFTKLSKINLRRLVDRLLTSQLVCVETEGYLIPAFTASLSPLSQVTSLGEIDFTIASSKERNGIIESTIIEPSPASKAGASNVIAAKSMSQQKSDHSDTAEDDYDDEEDEKSTETTKSSKSQPAPKLTPKSASKTEAMTQKADKASQRRRTFVDVVPTQCRLDGFQCTTDTGLELIFPTPIVIQELITDSYSYQMNEELKSIMLELEEDDEGCKFNLHGGYRSQDGFLSRQDRSVQWLKSQIVPRIQNLLRISNSSHLPFSVDGWGAVLRGGHNQNAHVHPGSMYAGVYYVTAPKEISKSGKSGGCLQFHDPRSGASMAQVVRGKNVYGDAIEVCPGHSGGLLVIFPSWLVHEVETVPADYQGPRIGISFNANYRP